MMAIDGIDKERDFRHMLAQIGKGLCKEDIEGLTFMCVDIPRGRQEDITTACQLWNALIELDKLDADNVLFLKDLLQTVLHRKDLVSKVTEYENYLQSQRMDYGILGHSTKLDNGHPDLSAEFKYITEHIGRYWKNLARALGVSDVNIDVAVEKHYRDLQSQCRETLLMWQKQTGGDKRDLRKALNNCGMNEIADEIKNM